MGVGVQEPVAPSGRQADHAGCQLNEDYSGRDRLLWNTVASWGGHLVFVVAGFLMPRLIDKNLGQSQLGLWDFGWTVVSYFGLAGIGIGSSVNRYVALYRSVRDTDGLSRAVSSVAAVQYMSAFLVVLVTCAATWSLPIVFGHKLGTDTSTARWVVFLLGLGLAVQMAFDYFRGVMTGCHRWDLHNALNSGFYGITVLGMIVVLHLGGGVRGLALVNFVGYAAAEFARAVVASWVCPELEVRLRHVSRTQMAEMAKFGGKSLLSGLARLLLLQANSLLVAGHLGVSALAVYSRPLALVRHVETLTGKFAFLLTPTASSLQTSRRQQELRHLLVEGTRYASLFALPMLIGLSLLGGPVLHVWMGPRYEHGGLLSILAAGAALSIIEQPALQILTGLDLHGPASIASVASAAVGILVGLVLVGPLGLGLSGAALALGVGFTAGNGLFVIQYACRTLGVRISSYLVDGYLHPLLNCLPFAAVLIVCRWYFSDPLRALVSGLLLGGVALALGNWRVLRPLLGKMLKNCSRTDALDSARRGAANNEIVGSATKT